MYTQNISDDFHKFPDGGQSADVAGFLWIAVFVLLDPCTEEGATTVLMALNTRSPESGVLAKQRLVIFFPITNGDRQCVEVQALLG